MSTRIESKLDVLIEKLDQILMLIKITNRQRLIEVKGQFHDDTVNKRILELADGTLNAQKLKKHVATDTDVSEKTVERRINELTSYGLITQRREGSEIFYEAGNLY